MDYFSDLDTSIKTDSEGNILYFPWGVLGKGYVLPTDLKKQEFRRFEKLSFTIFFLVANAIFFFGLITVGPVFGGISSLAIFPFFLAWHCFALARLLGGLAISKTRLSVREALTSGISGQSVWSLWLK